MLVIDVVSPRDNRTVREERNNLLEIICGRPGLSFES
jgi:hypothetical protein